MQAATQGGPYNHVLRCVRRGDSRIARKPPQTSCHPEEGTDEGSRMVAQRLLFRGFFAATQKWGNGPHASPNRGGAEQSEAEGFKTAVGVSISPTLSRW